MAVRIEAVNLLELTLKLWKRTVDSFTGTKGQETICQVRRGRRGCRGHLGAFNYCGSTSAKENQADAERPPLCRKSHRFLSESLSLGWRRGKMLDKRRGMTGFIQMQGKVAPSQPYLVPRESVETEI